MGGARRHHNCRVGENGQDGMEGTRGVWHHQDRALGERRLQHGGATGSLGGHDLDLVRGRGGCVAWTPCLAGHGEVVDSLQFLEHRHITRFALERGKIREGKIRERERGGLT